MNLFGMVGEGIAAGAKRALADRARKSTIDQALAVPAPASTPPAVAAPSGQPAAIAQSREGGIAPRMSPTVEPRRLVRDDAPLPAPSAPAAANPWDALSPAARSRDLGYIDSQIDKGFLESPKYGRLPTDQERAQWRGYALRPDTYSDRKVRVGWNDYLMDRLMTPGSEASSSVNPGDDTVIGIAPMDSGGMRAADGSVQDGQSTLDRFGDRSQAIEQIIAQLAGGAGQSAAAADALTAPAAGRTAPGWAPRQGRATARPSRRQMQSMARENALTAL